MPKEEMFMKEWLTANTSITEEEYNRYFQYKDAPKDLDLSKVSSDPKKLALLQIELFTLKPTMLASLKYGIKRTKKAYSYRGFNFELFSDSCTDKRLLSPDRYRKCIEMSINFALIMKLDIITGICTDFRDNKFLHSCLIGRDKDGKTYIFDYTRNLIMPKDEYYDLLDVEEIAILSNKDIKSIYEMIESYPDFFNSIGLSSFEVACFPKEIKEALSRELRKL